MTQALRDDEPQTAASDVVRTFCRLCEVGCGMVATVDDGRLTRVRPDHDHPVTKGFACSKGLRAADVHADPDRVLHPQRRDGDTFVPVSWDDALTEIARVPAAIIAEHGPGSVGVYLGNPTAFNALGSAGAMAFGAVLGTDRKFSSVTQDCSNKYAVSELLYGLTAATPIPDLERTELLLWIGSNPRATKSSFLSIADPVHALKQIRDRWRASSSSIPARSNRPSARRCNSDLTATPICWPRCSTRSIGASGSTPERSQDASTGSTRSWRSWLPTRPRRSPTSSGCPPIASPRWRTTSPPPTVRRSTPRPGSTWVARAHSPTGWCRCCSSSPATSTGRAATTSPHACSRTSSAPVDRTSGSFEHGPWGTFRRSVGMLPSAVLPEYIHDERAPLRALFVLAGNPVLSVGGGDRLEESLRSLELLVSIDVYRNATGELADFVLPATDQFEREDLNVFVQGVQGDPFVQWTPRVVAPSGEARQEWQIYGQLLQAMGRTPLLDPAIEDPVNLLFDGALTSGGTGVGALRVAGGVLQLPEPGPGGSLGRLGIDGTIDTVPDGLRSTLARATRCSRRRATRCPAGSRSSRGRRATPSTRGSTTCPRPTWTSKPVTSVALTSATIRTRSG